MRKINPFTATIITLFAFASAHQAHARTEMSEYRPNTQVDFIYNQDLEGVYSTDWLAKLEKTQGSSRTVYIETVGYFVNSGFVSFDCANPNANVDVKLYGWSEFGNESEARNISLTPKDIEAWKKDKFEPLMGEDPPYEFYQKLRSKYCKL